MRNTTLLPRLIPARAGNTIPNSSETSDKTAHPRSRGEHTDSSVCLGYEQGSSPLARGTLNRENHDLQRERLIPARAGNTVVRMNPQGALTAHPRSRGEHTSF